MATLVKFRKHPITGDLYAYFPQLRFSFNGYRPDNKTAYSHVGQHSACHPDYEKESRPATPFEYMELKQELESIGYTLKICK
jgi:hypothetical protein